jgi:enoyl-CoA hydratase
VVLTGDDRAFSSGFDLQDQAADPPRGSEAWDHALRHDFDAIMRFWTLSKPTIAAVRGAALAGGCELALACDLTIAAENARFGEPELKFGAGIVVMLMPWMTGPKQAKEILLTGLDAIDAAEAYRLGLVNRVVPAARTLEVALEIARKLAVVDPMVVRRTKAAINETYRIMGMEAALEAALAADVALEGEGSEDKRAFLAVLREQGLKGALAWRDARFRIPRA